MVDVISRHVIPAALSLLPRELTSPGARAMLIAMGLQESRFQHRRQVKGPARGFWQFEQGGVSGVLTHPASSAMARDFAHALRYPVETEAIHTALEHNDVLACGFARLLLWTLPDTLPEPTEPIDGWSQYLNAWRPGKPHEATWAAFFQEGWKRSDG